MTRQRAFDYVAPLNEAAAGEDLFPTERVGQIYQDIETIAEIHALVDAGHYREARAAISRVHSNREKTKVFDLIMNAETTAKEAVHAAL